MELKKSLDFRDYVYKQDTIKALDTIAPTLEGAIEFIDELYGESTSEMMSWEGLGLVDDILTIIGVIRYDEGTQLVLDDTEITITAENQEEYQQTIRVGIPMDVVLMNSAEKTYLYLLSTKDDESDDDTAIESLSGLVGFNIDELDSHQLTSLINNTSTTVH